MDHGRLVEAIRTGDGDAAASEAAGYPFMFMCQRRPAGAGD
jgi:hypothetical protein